MTMSSPPDPVPPPPPDPVSPVDASGMVIADERPLSVPAVASLICGILFCIPILSGVLAVLLGIGGIVQTGPAKKRGRWMAVAGLLLGIASVGIWTFGGGTALVVYIYKHHHSETEDAPGAITATNNFLRAVSDDNNDVIKDYGGELDPDSLMNLRTYCKSQGSFVDTSVNASVTNGTAELSGTAQYTLRNQTLKATLTYVDNGWKITAVEIHPILSATDATPAPAPGGGGGDNSLPVHGPGGGGNEELPTPTPSPTLAPTPMPTPAPAPAPAPAAQPLTNGAVTATEEFIRGLCDGDENLVAKHDGGFSAEARQSFTDYFKPLGKLTGTNFTGVAGPQSTAVTGTAVFENGKQSVKANLVQKDGEWKVVSIDVNPIAP